jgi:hypothetical protein
MHRIATKQTEVWTIDEHPNPEACFDWIRANWHDLYDWHEDNAASLRAFADHFGFTIVDYRYGGNATGCDIRPDESMWSRWDQASEVTGVRLWKYLRNNGFYDYFDKYRRHTRKDQLLDGDCPFTGFCMDEVLLDPFREFDQRPAPGMTIAELASEAGHRWAVACDRDFAYAYSDEGLREMCEANEYEFDQSGRVY